MFWFWSLEVLASGLFGPEWTFTNDEVISIGHLSSSKLIHFKKTWIERLKVECREICVVSETGKVHLRVDPSVFFQIGHDPLVLEVTATPMTVDQFKMHQNFFQRFVFDMASEIGLQTHWRIGGGHIHMDLKSHFAGDSFLFRQFIVDIANNPELFMGFFGLDLLNAPPISTLSIGAQDKFGAIIDEFDRGEMSIKLLVKRIRQEVYSESPVLQESVPYDERTHRYHLMNLNHVPKTVELRGFGPQQSTQHYLDLIELLHLRMEFLKSVKKKIKLKIPDYHDQYTYEALYGIHSYRVRVPKEVIDRKARDWVQECGGSWPRIQNWQKGLQDKMQQQFCKDLLQFR